MNLLKDFDQMLSSGDDGIDCPENNDEVSQPQEIGAKQGAANNDNLLVSQPHDNQPPAASLPKLVLEVENEAGDAQNGEDIEEIL